MKQIKMVFYAEKASEDELKHYGILGMKWGVRRYQNPDGSLTEAGRRRYDVGKKEFKKELKADNAEARKLNIEAASLGQAHILSQKYVNKRSDKYAKAILKGYENTQKGEKAKLNKEIAERTEAEVKKQYEDAVKIMMDHYNEMVEKYGATAVSDIDYKTDKKTGETVVDIDMATKRLNKVKRDAIGFCFGAMGAVIGLDMMEKTDPKYRGAIKYAEIYNEVKKSLAESLVSKSSKSDFTDSGSFTKEYKDRALNDAKEKDRYNLEFLERIQNKTYLSSDDPKSKAKRLREYKKFLESESPYSYRPPEGDEE